MLHVLSSGLCEGSLGNSRSSTSMPNIEVIAYGLPCESLENLGLVISQSLYPCLHVLHHFALDR